jgi:hypothetical protein
MPLVKYFFVGATAAVIDIGLFILFANYLVWPWIPVSICTFSPCYVSKLFAFY